MHDQGIVHGDIKGVRGCALSYLLCETDPPPQVEHPNRQYWPRRLGRLRSTRDNPGRTDRHILGPVWWHNPMGGQRVVVCTGGLEWWGIWQGSRHLLFRNGHDRGMS